MSTHNITAALRHHASSTTPQSIWLPGTTTESVQRAAAATHGVAQLAKGGELVVLAIVTYLDAEAEVVPNAALALELGAGEPRAVLLAEALLMPRDEVLELSLIHI